MSLLMLLSMLMNPGLAQASPAQYPKICGFKGIVWLESAAGGVAKVKLNEVLHEKAAFKSEAGAIICVDLSKTDRLVIGENSNVNIPFIELESGSVPEIFLLSGHFRLVNESGVNRTVASDLFRETVKRGDFVVSFDRVGVLGTLDVLSGETNFRGLENEESVQLKEGETASFRGDAVEGQIQYDVLLKGKKVARGKLNPKKTLSPAEVEAFKRKLQWAKVKIVRDDDEAGPGVDSGAGTAEGKGEKKGYKSNKKKGAKKKGDPVLICSKPDGKFNQCAWICEKNPKGAKKCLVEKANVKCVRQRCNANGEWEDRFEYSKDRALCEGKTVIKACDY